MITQKQLCDQIAHAVDNIIEKVKFVKNIFKDIHDARGKVLLVGGAVRDIVLEKSFHESQDLDFEVYRISLEELTVILEKYGKVDFVGRSFGVLRLSG
jgi:tRNA nucleotidyltransferase (CCA-adding enzyme)